jgi:hypothetical protein
MVDLNPLLDNCKPRGVHFNRSRIAELASSLDEMLEPAPTQRIVSYDQALQLIRQFSHTIKDCNFIIEPEN